MGGGSFVPKAFLWPTTDTQIPGPHSLLRGRVEPALLRLAAGPTRAASYQRPA